MKNKRPSPDSDSSYVDSGGEGEREEEGALSDVDASTVPPLAKRKVSSSQSVCLHLLSMWVGVGVCVSPEAVDV